MLTIGQAVDEAIRRHRESFPGSEVYQVEAEGMDLTAPCRLRACTNEAHHAGSDVVTVTLRATHFSHALRYEVER